MDHTFNISDFDTEKLFAILKDQYKYENEIITEDIYCRNIKDLRKEGGIIICCLDIFRLGLPLEEYYKFSTYNEDWESFVKENGEDEKAGILTLSQENGWSPDEGLAMSITGEEIGLAIKVSLDQDKIKLEQGLVRSDLEKGSDTFHVIPEFGMPEINKFIRELTESCILPSNID
jgi:hypothetical protein